MITVKEYLERPIIGAYFYLLGRLKTKKDIDRYLEVMRNASINSVWLFVGGVEKWKIKYFLDKAEELGLKVVPVFQPHISINEHPEVKVVCADGTTADDPRYANIGCFNNPLLFNVAKEMVEDFIKEFGKHPALYRISGLPLMSFIHEAYYRTDVPEFGGGPLKPCCYCKYCVEGFRSWIKGKYGDIKVFNEVHGTNFRDWNEVEPPRSAENPSLWKEWLDYHAEIIPNFLRKLISFAKNLMPLLATHELNDFYPCTYQCVYSGNDIFRMAKVIDIGHEDMYPLEFDHRYVIYVYEYIKDLVRSAMGFNKIYTCNGQAFNSWMGYKIPIESFSEQIYSSIAHGSLGLVWWVDWNDLNLWRKTKRANEEYSKLLRVLKDYELYKADVALVYPWTTMELKRDDIYNTDNLLFYMALVRSGYPVDIISEDQIEEGILESRGYKALCVIGAPVLPPNVISKIKEFVYRGGILILDYAGEGVNKFTTVFPELIVKPKGDHTVYYIDTDIPIVKELNGRYIPVEMFSEVIEAPKGSKKVAVFENGEPAIVVIDYGKGKVIKAATLLGWDYSNYPGHYDFAVMFPFHIRRREVLRELITRLLKYYGIKPPAETNNPDIEVSVWISKKELSYVILVINHIRERNEATVKMKLKHDVRACVVQDVITNAQIQAKLMNDTLEFNVSLDPLEGRAFLVKLQE